MALLNAMERLRLDDRADHGDQPKQFILGLDYGTTYSAGAFCLRTKSTIHLISGEIKAFKGYHLGRNNSKSKSTEIPSDIRYGTDGIKIGYDAIQTGPSPNPVHRVRRAKLGLDERPSTDLARRDLHDDLSALSPTKKPEEVIADYLTEIFTIFLERLQNFGYQSGDSIELNCAIPSVWNHKARRTMVNAMEVAGRRSGLAFDPVVKLWPEAEAATEYVLNKQENLSLRVSRPTSPPSNFQDH